MKGVTWGNAPVSLFWTGPCHSTRSPCNITNNVPRRLAYPPKLKETMNHARPALAGAVHALFGHMVMQGFAFVT